MHISFTEAVNQIAKEPWGQNFKTTKEAEKHLVDDCQKLAAFGIVELLQRLDRLSGNHCEHDSYIHKAEITEKSKPFPDKAVGDLLFHGNLDEGISEAVIIAKNSDGMCLVVDSYWDLDHPPQPYIACSNRFATLHEAIRMSAEDDRKYYGPRLKYAEEALRALEEGSDVQRFIDSYTEKADE